MDLGICQLLRLHIRHLSNPLKGKKTFPMPSNMNFYLKNSQPITKHSTIPGNYTVISVFNLLGITTIPTTHKPLASHAIALATIHQISTKKKQCKQCPEWIRLDKPYIYKQFSCTRTQIATEYICRENKMNKKKKFGPPEEIKLHKSAIWMAVFCLSPVNIQKLIPACLNVSIVSGTPS